MPKYLVECLTKLLSALFVPFGVGSGHCVSGNSNGKKIIELLLLMSMYDAKRSCAPEILQCGDKLYRVHTSTHVSHQPSQVEKGKGKVTQDSFVTLVAGLETLEDKSRGLSYLTCFYQFIPPILVADADSTMDPIKHAEKRDLLFKSLASYRRGYGTAVEIMGLFYSNNHVYTSILKSGSEVPADDKRYCTLVLDDILELVNKIHVFLHKIDIKIKQIDEFCIAKYKNQFGKRKRKRAVDKEWKDIEKEQEEKKSKESDKEISNKESDDPDILEAKCSEFTIVENLLLIIVYYNNNNILSGTNGRD